MRESAWSYLLMVSVSVAAVSIGCATTNPGTRVLVEVDALAVPAAALKRVVIVPQRSDITKSDLEFQEYAKYASYVLRRRGYLVQEDSSNADLVVFLGFGISDPKTNIATYSVPVWGQVGSVVTGATTTSTVNMVGRTGYVTSNTSTSTQPVYGVSGVASNTFSYDTYSRILALTAYDLESYKKDGSAKEVFRTVAHSSGLSGDLRRVAPYMAFAMEPFVGTRTEGRVQIAVSVTDLERVGLVQRPPEHYEYLHIGAVCSASSQCEPGLSCPYGRCIGKPRVPTPAEDKRREEQVLETWGSPLGTPCATDSECKPGLICPFGFCRNPDSTSSPTSSSPGSGERGASCKSNADCMPGLTCPYGRCLSSAPKTP